jgi:hypothetical protein
VVQVFGGQPPLNVVSCCRSTVASRSRSCWPVSAPPRNRYSAVERMRSYRVGLSCIVALLLLQLFLPALASAQAWLPRKNTGSISINYKNFHIKYHTDVNGVKLRPGVVDAHVVSVDADYGLTRRWALNLSVPYSTLKYTGPNPHVDPDHHIIDDGYYHGGVQDFRFGARFALFRYTPVVVTPFVEGIVPSHNYTTFAHAALGRNLHEVLVGTNIGWEAETPIYAQARISYGFVEKVLGRSHNRTNIDAQFTYALTSLLQLSALASVAKHHGGLDADSTKGSPAQQWTPEELLHHDELTRADMFDMGGTVAFNVKGSTIVHATMIHTVWSRNAHPWNTGVIVGVSFRFRTRPPVELPPSSLSEVPFTQGCTLNLLFGTIGFRARDRYAHPGNSSSDNMPIQSLPSARWVLR